jgi:dipeptidyl aminopeptidase/acylaminoacyl peptidase
MLRDQCQGTPRIIGRARDDRRWLVQDISDHRPATFHVFDPRSGAMDLLFSAQPDLERYTFSRVEPFSLRARDGLALHGYLTFPIGDRSHLPTVLVVHGGPWSRDLWGLRGESQWLANRGYLCVQINYRGSTGYGKAFTNAGDLEWGGHMQDDLTDTVAWAVKRGLADPDRVAIYGSSYGGYAALCGAAFTPDLYRCAIAHAAPTDLRTFIRNTPAYNGANATRLLRRVGDPSNDADLLWSRSPLSGIDRVRIPLLISHGVHDPRVPVDESRHVVAALKRGGVPHQYLLFEDEGHTLTRPRNRLAFYAACERFLARHLGGRYQATVPS